MINNLAQKNKEQLLDEFASKGAQDHTTLEGIQYPTAILVRSVQDLQRSAHNINDSIKFFKETVDKIGESSNNLSKKVFWLNVCLAIATLVGATATAILAFK